MSDSPSQFYRPDPEENCKIQDMICDNCEESLEDCICMACQECGSYECMCHEDDGQPSEYDEWQDFYGGDDWDHGQFDDY